MEIWGKEMITAQMLRAAFSFPFIYPPCTIGGKDYIEGAALRPLNFEMLVSSDENSSEGHSDIDSVIVLDILRSEKLIQSPRNLYDAWVRSTMVPLVQAARNELQLFQLKNANTANGSPPRKILVPDLTASIPDEYWPNVIDWSSSNMHFLFDVGYAAVIQFCNDMADDLAYVRPLTAKQPAAASSASTRRSRRRASREPVN
jgi:predicted acylesterase/phospholipase RssA